MSLIDPRAALDALAEDGVLLPLEGVEGAFVRQLSIGEMDRINRDEESSGYLLFALSVCRSDGNPLYTEAEIDKVKAIKAGKFNPLLKQAMAANGMIPDATTGEDAAKN